MKMLKKASLAILAVIIFMVKEMSAPNLEYLGSGPTKPYHFPWLVTFHRYTPIRREFFGSGSILTAKWVIGSMDCFIRPSRDDNSHNLFYQDIDLWEVHSGGIWANPLEREDLPSDTPWFQVRKVAEVHMFADPATRVRTLSFFAGSETSSNYLNSIKRSPFGMSMSIALIKVKKFPGSSGRDEWDWRRSTLPIPLFGKRAQQIKSILEHELEYLEGKPFAWRCHVGGWHNGDWRLSQYEVVYVPFKQCRSIFCANDDRACFTWPVKGVHVCFKSLTFTDPCWRDQGSALYCKQIADSVVAILTSAPTCGFGGLPAVFTLVHHGLELYQRVAPSSDAYEPIPEEERKKYTPPPEKYLIPAYG